MGRDDPGGPVFPVPWTAAMALRAARATGRMSRAERLERIRDAADEGRLPDAAVDQLIAHGFPELAEPGE